MNNYVENGVIYKARVTLVLHGYGDLSLTDKAIFWNKAATTFLAFGVFGAASNNHVLIPFDAIAKVGTYTYMPGGGITILLKDGKKYKIAFKKSKDFNFVYGYLKKLFQ